MCCQLIKWGVGRCARRRVSEANRTTGSALRPEMDAPIPPGRNLAVCCKRCKQSVGADARLRPARGNAITGQVLAPAGYHITVLHVGPCRTSHPGIWQTPAGAQCAPLRSLSGKNRNFHRCPAASIFFLPGTFPTVRRHHSTNRFTLSRSLPGAFSGTILLPTQHTPQPHRR